MVSHAVCFTGIIDLPGKRHAGDPRQVDLVVRWLSQLAAGGVNSSVFLELAHRNSSRVSSREDTLQLIDIHRKIKPVSVHFSPADTSLCERVDCSCFANMWPPWLEQVQRWRDCYHSIKQVEQQRGKFDWVSHVRADYVFEGVPLWQKTAVSAASFLHAMSWPLHGVTWLHPWGGEQCCAQKPELNHAYILAVAAYFLAVVPL